MDPDGDITGLRDITAEIIIKNYAPVFVGTHSHVLKGFWHGKPIAIKVLRVISREQRVMRRKITRERDIWSHLKHPHIVPLYGYTEESEVFGLLGALVSPWHQNGDAAAYLESRGASLTMVQRIELWRGVVAGVTYLHSHNPSIIHGDLKPGNILIDEDGTARLCDFGLARIFLEEGSSGTTTTSDHTGTDRYLAYELVVSRDPSVVSKASDIYALGCIGLYFVFLQSPYENRRNNLLGEIFQDIRDGIPPASQPSNVSSESLPFWSLLEACWNLQSPERPEAAAILDWLDLQYDHFPSCKEAIKKEKPIMPLQLNGVINSREGESLPQASDQEGRKKGALSSLFSEKARPQQVPSSALDPIPPDKPIKETGSVQQDSIFVRALYSFPGIDESSLRFQRGDIIVLFSKSSSGLWEGGLGEEQGWFPSNYVEVISEAKAKEAFEKFEEDKLAILEEEFWVPEVESNGTIFFVNSRTGEKTYDIPKI